MELTKKERILIYIGVVVIFLLATLSHNLYKWTNYNDFIGIFTPTNESIFQHLKIIIYPTIFYYLIAYLIFNNKYEIVANKWFLCALITIVLTSLVVIGMYYTFHYGFEIESMIIDIMSLVIGLAISSLICAHIYRFKENIKFSYIASLILIIFIAITTSYYDVNPSHVDLFYDHQNHTYERVTE